MPIIKRIRQVGSSAGVLLPKALLELLGWDTTTEVTLTPKAGTLVLAKAGSPAKAKVARA